jgi:hypothetical protein
MATSSRQSTIFGTNDWKTIYKTFSQADFQSYDYETLRKTFVDYLRTYYPETFNDYTESSEYVALLDLIAFMGQSLSFRDDLNTRENFIDTAERRDSVIKLANLVGYTPKRNLSGQGFLKIVSLATSENVNDINGINLSGTTVLWNDPSNTNWQEQFNTILNAALVTSQRIGRPGNTQTVLGVKTSEYSIQIPTNALPTVGFTQNISGSNMNFELVSSSSAGEDYVYELSPKANGSFNLLYRNDNLGYGSANTGFFIYFKQGTLRSQSFTLAQKISNQVVNVNTDGINNTDTWLFKVDPVTNALTEWKQVDNIYNNSLEQMNIFSVDSRSNDQVSYVFGDGVFGEIPIGTFRAYYRVSNALQYNIDPSEIQGTTVSLSYVSKTNRIETLTITLQLTQPVTNAQARESIADIKLRAPTRFYTQNRMVNGEDYNVFPKTLYSSVLKSKALNRSSIGVSRNFDLLDPTAKYSSVNSFAEDGALYFKQDDEFQTLTLDHGTTSVISFLTNKLLSILTSRRMQQYYVANANRYTVTDTSWKQTSFNGTNITGYFNSISLSTSIPIGIYSANSMKYCTTGALIKFVAPSGFVFQNNRLVAKLPGPGDLTYVWTSVVNVVDDGYNGGVGNLYNGLGPVTLSHNIPTGALVSTIIPVFDNIVPSAIIQNAIARCTNNQSFSLNYDNSLSLADTRRWSISDYSTTNFLVNFNSQGNGVYSVTNKALAYYFGSANDTRFSFDRSKIIYDPLSGKSLYDTVKVLKSNTLPASNANFGDDITLAVVGQPVESDGYVDDYSIEVSVIDPSNNKLISTPDFFGYITGYSQGINNYVFVEKIIDSNLLNKYRIIPSTDIVTIFNNLVQIQAIKYEYPVGQKFYATAENVFYQTVADATSANILNVVVVIGISTYTGRQGLFFQYKHNSSNTGRINPATTNIIDMYLVTQSYYTQYRQWITDTTGKVAEPTAPTINELAQSYGKIEDYKMLSDSVILNSVKFKPLFGTKADPQLQAIIKVVKVSKTTASDSEISIAVVNAVNKYFDISNWDFGDTFYFSELSAYLHSELGDLIGSAILIPKDPTLKFGDLYEVRSAPNEIFTSALQVSDIQIITSLTANEFQIISG